MLEAFLKSPVVDWLVKGQICMVPLTLCSIFMLAVILERRRSLRDVTIDVLPFRAEILALLRQGRLDEAVALCERTPGPVAEILNVGVQRYRLLKGLGRAADDLEEGVVKAMEDHAPHVVANLERYLTVLSTVGTIAPLFGFLGTVTGMVRTFDAIVAHGGADVKYISSGIAEALITTVFGLVIAIPAFSAYNYFTTRVKKFLLEIEETSTHLMEAVVTGETGPPGAVGAEKAAGNKA